jgi:hypothetical protein
MVEGREEFVDRVGPESISHLRAVEGNPDRALIAGSVVGDVGEGERFDRRPAVGIEVLGDHAGSVNPGS